MRTLLVAGFLPALLLQGSCRRSAEGSVSPPDQAGDPIRFVRASQSFPAASTFEVVLGDVDADGDLDAVFSNMGPNACTVWLNDGAGRFVDSGQRLMQQGHGARLADLDADGDLDLFLVGGTWGDDGGLHTARSRAYRNDGTGRFQDGGQDLGDTALHGNGVEVADVDGDGDLDADVHYFDPAAQGFVHRVYLNDGHGAFATGGPPLPARSQVSWGDLDRDGDVDAFARVWGVGYRTLLNPGSGVLSQVWEALDAGVVEGAAALGDLDGDGDADVLVTDGSVSVSRPSGVFVNDGTGRFTDSGLRLAATRWASVCLGDLDLDGDLDAFVVNYRLPSEVWANDGSGRFADSGLRLGGNAETHSCALGDLDGDGDFDAMVSDYGSGFTSVWLNQAR